MGQLSDPYQQGEDDLGITISGVPSELLEPEATSGPLSADQTDDETPADRGQSGDSITYDLDDWSELERQAIADRLREAGVPHGWDGARLRIAAVDEALVENILDIVEGDSDEAELEPLDADRDQIAYDVSDLSDEQLDALAEGLRAADIAFSWGDEEMYVYADDEAAVDDLFERAQYPDEIAAEDDETPAEQASADLLGNVFVAADRLAHDADDGPGRSSLLDVAVTIDDLDAPYGMGGRDWEAVCAAVGRLADELTEDEPDETDVQETARDVRAVLRPFV